MNTALEITPFILKNRTRNPLKLIPCIGCKAGFSHIFDQLIPEDLSGRLIDVFGGGGSFTFYASQRFGGHQVTYNDNNPVLLNLMRSLPSSPDELWRCYQEHFMQASVEYYYQMRKRSLDNGIEDAARFLYLAKNAFSGKIRFNRRNRFNSPIRKGSQCPRLKLDTILNLSELIQDVRLTNQHYQDFRDVKDSFLYLDPPYFNNTNGHYNGILGLDQFKCFIQKVAQSNNLLLSEQNDPRIFELGPDLTVFPIQLVRALQYNTQKGSREIVAFNF